MFYLIQVEDTLKAMDTAGTIVTLTLPVGVTIDPAVRGKAAILVRQLFFVNAASANLWIDPITLDVFLMALAAPGSAPTIAATGVGVLSGRYRVKVAFGIKDGDGNVLNLSPAGDVSNDVTLDDEQLNITNIPVSADTNVTFRRIYRTAAGGTLFFEQEDIDDNVTTSLVTNMSDEELSLLPEDPDIELPPERFRLLTEWKSRLWGVGDEAEERDELRYTEPGQFYAWAADNAFPIAEGEDAFGIVGFLRRRDSLGVLKRTRVVKMVGSTETGFEPLIVAEGIGCISAESCVVIRDKGYFLGLDGVYRWDDDGLVNISKATVDSWFTEDVVFNRDRFRYAFASHNPVTDCYELNLALAGETEERVWIAYDLEIGKWYGPHFTDAMTPTARAQELLRNDESVAFGSIGAEDGFIYQQNQATPFSDVDGTGAKSAIASQCIPAWASQKNPPATHYWGQLLVLTRIEDAGTLSITPTVGGLNAAAGASMAHDLTLGYERLRRMGVGRLLLLEFEQATIDRRWLLYGYDFVDAFEVGQR